MKLLLTTFGVAVASALFPLINIEAYLATVGALVHSYGIWPVSLIAAAGQAVGKVFWYEIGRTSMRWGYLQRKMEAERWKTQYEKVRQRTHERPWLGIVILFASATLGVPPLAVMAVFAGQLEFNRFWFYVTVFVGRTLRFAAVLGGISLLAHSSLFN